MTHARGWLAGSWRALSTRLDDDIDMTHAGSWHCRKVVRLKKKTNALVGRGLAASLCLSCAWPLQTRDRMNISTDLGAKIVDHLAKRDPSVLGRQLPTKLLTDGSWWENGGNQEDAAFIASLLHLLPQHYGLIAMVNKWWRDSHSITQKRLRTQGFPFTTVTWGNSKLLRISTRGKGRWSFLYIKPQSCEVATDNSSSPIFAAKSAIVKAAAAQCGWHIMNLRDVFKELPASDVLKKTNEKHGWACMRRVAGTLGTVKGKGGKTTLEYFLYPSTNEERGTLFTPRLVFATASLDGDRAAETFQLIVNCPVMQFCRNLREWTTLALKMHIPDAFPFLLPVMKERLRDFISKAKALSSLSPFSLRQLLPTEPPQHPIQVLLQMERFDADHADWSNGEGVRNILQEIQHVLAQVVSDATRAVRATS